MSIVVGTKSTVFLLSTENTSYAFGIDDQGLVRHLYWGKKLPSAEELEMPVLTEVSTNDPVYEITPEEFPVHGGCATKSTASRPPLPTAPGSWCTGTPGTTPRKTRTGRSWCST